MVPAHLSWQLCTQAAKTTGLVGHPEMHADKDPPGQSDGDGDGLGVGGVGGDGGVGGGVGCGQLSSQTPLHASNAAPVNEEHADKQASYEPPGQFPGEGVGGLGGIGDGEGSGNSGCVDPISPHFRFIIE